jgi:hypothetical protein
MKVGPELSWNGVDTGSSYRSLNARLAIVSDFTRDN